WRDATVEKVQDQIKDIKNDKPAEWATLVKSQENEISRVEALTVVRHATMENLDLSDTKDIKSFIKDKLALLKRGRAAFAKPSDLKPILEALKPEARKELAIRFDELSKDEQKVLTEKYTKGSSAPSVAGFYGVDNITEDEKALAIVNHGYAFAPRSVNYLLTEVRDAITNNEASEILADGPLASRDKFETWVKGDKFEAWAQDANYSGPQTFDKMSLDDVEKIVIKTLPMVESMKTVYSDMTMDIMLSRQMAMLLKDGELPAASFDSEPVRTPLGL
ncbi:hypothetical protein KAI87_04975, partial [Myxococcota bacterium]|nr:hypothetical protein [Myxococcota bacterium]